MTPYEELHKKFKLAPQDDESFESFALRATKRVNALSDPEWGQLSEPVQLWINEVLKARDAKQALPELEGYPEEADSNAGTAEGEEEEEEEETPSEASPDVAEPDAGADESSGNEVVDAEAGSEVDDAPEAEVSGRRGRVERVRPVQTSRPKPSKKPKPETRAKPKTGKGRDKTMNKASKVAANKKAVAGDRISDDSKIKILAKENPHRAGTKLFGYFRKYRDGMTVAAAKKAGIPPKNILYLQSLGSIKVIAA